MRVKITKSKNATSLYIIKDIFVNNKRTTAIQKKLGTLEYLMATLNLSEEEVVSWAQNEAKRLAQLEKQNCREIAITLTTAPDLPSLHSKNVGYLFLKEIYYLLGFDLVCASIGPAHGFSGDLNRIVELLVYARILYPTSSPGAVNLNRGFVERLDFSSLDVHRTIAFLERYCEPFLDQLFCQSAQLDANLNQLVYYEWTDFPLAGIDSPDGHKPISLGLFCTKSGRPLACLVGDGPKSTPTATVERIRALARQFPAAGLLVCSDTGPGASSSPEFHRLSNLFATRSNIICMRPEKIPAELVNWAYAPEGWKVPGSDATGNLAATQTGEKSLYKERRVCENGISQRLIAIHCPKRHRAMSSAPSQTDIVKATGTEDITDLLEAYGRRLKIEETLGLIKNDFKVKDSTGQTKTRFKAHFLICFMALMIEHNIETRLRGPDYKGNWKKALRTMNVVALKDAAYLPDFEATGTTERLNQTSSLDFYREMITPEQMKMMIYGITDK